jgi:hypothetical protein
MTWWHPHIRHTASELFGQCHSHIHAEPGWPCLHLLYTQGFICWAFFSLPGSYWQNLFFSSLPRRTQFHCPIACLFTSGWPRSCWEEDSEIRWAAWGIVPQYEMLDWVTTLPAAPEALWTVGEAWGPRAGGYGGGRGALVSPTWKSALQTSQHQKLKY